MYRVYNYIYPAIKLFIHVYAKSYNMMCEFEWKNNRTGIAKLEP